MWHCDVSAAQYASLSTQGGTDAAIECNTYSIVLELDAGPATLEHELDSVHATVSLMDVFASCITCAAREIVRVGVKLTGTT
jgi:hypothetical protein